MMAIVSGILAGLSVLTQLQDILSAIVLSYVLALVQQRLERYLSSTMAAITLIVI